MTSSSPSAIRRMARKSRQAVRNFRQPGAATDVLVSLGLRRYEPKPWTIDRWNRDYANGNLDYFGQLSERPRFSVIVGYLDHVSPTGQILDAGCGNGFLFERARHLDFSLWRGVDLSSAAIDLATERNRTDDRAVFQAADLLDETGAWAEHKYEVVVINEVLNMCDDPERLLVNVIERMEAKSGRLVISGWRHRGDHQLWRLIDRHTRTLDAVQLVPAMNNLAPRGWRVALLAKR